MLEEWFLETRARMKTSGRPFITLTYAQALDGSITHRRGAPGLAISGPETKALTHWLRTQHDGLLIGIGTLLSDDSKLTVTHAEGPAPRPIILDAHLRTQPQARVFNHPKRPLIACFESHVKIEKANRLRAAGAELLALKKRKEERIDLDELLDELPRYDIHSLMVEGGAQVITSFLQQSLADVAIITIAPFFVGGVNAITEALPHQPRLKNSNFARYGEDLVMWGELTLY